MSEPVTSAEVEDVLSSIRRLVSEDKRPMQASSSASAPEQDEATATPAKDAAAASASEAEPTVASGDFTPHVPKSVSTPEKHRDAVQQMPSFRHRTADAEPSDEPKERPFFTSRKIMNPPAEAPVDPAADRLVLTPALRVATSDGKDRPLRAAEASRPGNRPENEAENPANPAVSPFDYDMLHDDPADLHADDYGDTTSNETAAVPVGAKPAADAPAIDAPAADDSTDLRSDKAFAAARFTPAGPKPSEGKLSDKIAALETAIGQIAGNWEPDSPGDDDYSGTEDPAMVWEDDVEPEAEVKAEVEPQQSATSEPKSERKPAARIEEQVRRFADSGPRMPDPVTRAAEAPSEASNGLGVEDGFLDEEALRDLVTEIVRAELQGALGERITRNVRKLVRREIHRAMTAQDLE